MAERISSSALHRGTGEILERAIGGESFELTRHGRVVALLVPASYGPLLAAAGGTTVGEVRSVADAGLDADHAEAQAALEVAHSTGDFTFGGSSSNTGTITTTQMDPTDASHPSRRPAPEADPQRAQRQRDVILNNLGGKKTRSR